MFTGIVAGSGRVLQIEARPDGAVRLSVGLRGLPDVSRGLRLGDSVAVSGCCLTVASDPAQAEDAVTFDVIPQTLRRTTLGQLRVGDAVNLERCVRADGRLDGHVVQGHVDEVGVVDQVEVLGDDWRMWVRASAELIDLTCPRGSVAIDGVSLTVADVDERRLMVALIPTTLQLTTLGRLQPGSGVNLEADILARQVAHWLSRRAARA